MRKCHSNYKLRLILNACTSLGTNVCIRKRTHSRCLRGESAQESVEMLHSLIHFIPFPLLQIRLLNFLFSFVLRKYYCGSFQPAYYIFILLHVHSLGQQIILDFYSIKIFCIYAQIIFREIFH